MALDSTSYVDSLDRKISDDDTISVGEKIPEEDKEYEGLLDRLTIEKVLKGLNEVERKIIVFRYYKEKTQTEISKILRNIASSSIEVREKSTAEDLRCLCRGD
jgi:RNA polymerase sporulation-specific sigma factor